MHSNLGQTLRHLKLDQDLDVLLQQIPRVIGQQLGFDRCLLFLSEGDRIEPVSLWIRQGEQDLLAQAPSLAEILLAEKPRAAAALNGKSTIADGLAIVPIRPFLGEGAAIGVIVADRLSSPIEELDLEKLTFLAGFLGLAILNARQLQEISLLNRISNLLSSSLDLDQVLYHLLEELSQLLPIDRGEVLLYSKELGGLVLTACTPPDPDRLGTVSPCALARKVFEQRKTAPLSGDHVCRARLRSGLCLSLRLPDQESIGVVCLGSLLPDAFSAPASDVVGSICNQAAIAVHNAQQFKLQKDLDQLKSEFISTVSHELRTPLTSIKGFAGTLLKPDLELPPEARRHVLEIIDRQADHLSKLIEELFSATRLDSGKVSLSLEETPLDEVIRQTLESLQNILAPFELEADLIPLTLMVDRKKVVQVISNLLENAAKYSPKGRKIEISLQEKGKGAVVRIADQGIGIPPESRHSLFQKFSRIDNTLTREIGGTGLGLYISSKLVEAHGGRIWIEDPSWGQGTCIGFFLPPQNP